MAKPETSEQQQSYFYVVWPEERSPAAAATAPTATNLIAMNAGPPVGTAASSLTPIDTLLQPSSSSPPMYTGLAAHSTVVPGTSNLPLIGATGHSPTLAARAAVSGAEDSDSSDAGSPVAAATSQSTATAISGAQTVTITDTGEFSGSLAPVSSTTPHSVTISPRSHAFNLTANGAGILTTVNNSISSSPGLIYVSDAASMFPRPTVSLPTGPGGRGIGTSYSIGGSAATILQPVQENLRKQKYPHSSPDVPPLKSIGM